MRSSDDRGRREVSRDASVAFFEIAIAGAEVATDEPQVALDRFDGQVWAYATRGGVFRYTQMPEALDRAATLATFACYRYTKLIATIAAKLDRDTADWLREEAGRLMLADLESDAAADEE